MTRTTFSFTTPQSQKITRSNFTIKERSAADILQQAKLWRSCWLSYLYTRNCYLSWQKETIFFKRTLVMNES